MQKSQRTRHPNREREGWMCMYCTTRVPVFIYAEPVLYTVVSTYLPIKTLWGPENSRG
jgi:hypothetical protein